MLRCPRSRTHKRCFRALGIKLPRRTCLTNLARELRPTRPDEWVRNKCGAAAPQSVQIFGTHGGDAWKAPSNTASVRLLTVFSLDTIPVCVDNCLRIERCLVWL